LTSDIPRELSDKTENKFKGQEEVKKRKGKNKGKKY
jgi:hypothetical protein